MFPAPRAPIYRSLQQRAFGRAEGPRADWWLARWRRKASRATVVCYSARFTSQV